MGRYDYQINRIKVQYEAEKCINLAQDRFLVNSILNLGVA